MDFLRLDFLRRHTLFRHGLLAALIATGIYTAPSLFAADGSPFGINLFQHASVLFTIVLGFAAFRVEDHALRQKLVLAVVLGFALLEVLVLGLTSVVILFLALAILFALVEYPQDVAEVSTY
jgi:hypothetical protein